MMDYTPPPAILRAAEGTSQPELLLAISYVESRWNPKATGKAGEIGALQIHPRYHNVPKSLDEQFKYADRYLQRLWKRCGPQLFLMCYNAGPKKVMLDKVRVFSYTEKVQEAFLAIQDAKNKRAATSDKTQIRITTND